MFSASANNKSRVVVSLAARSMNGVVGRGRYYVAATTSSGQFFRLPTRAASSLTGRGLLLQSKQQQQQQQRGNYHLLVRSIDCEDSLPKRVTSERCLSTASGGKDKDDNDGSDSHSDFAPRRRAPADSTQDEAMALIDEHVKGNKVMLYMKGSPSLPMCGFSATVVQILKDQEVDFASVNVLDYPAIREGVKAYSDWPTIPQLYVDGEFIGGCDIVTSMNESGELKELLSSAKEGKSE